MPLTFTVDHAVAWDWLPHAARELEQFLQHVLRIEGAVELHDVSVRAKSMESFQRKIEVKGYESLSEVTDCVAARVITYSPVDRERVVSVLRSTFTVVPGEDRNPGLGRPIDKQGYDSWHLVINGVQDRKVLQGRAALERYFTAFSGLEIQIRTVAAHAWAEFEHKYRYKRKAIKIAADDQRKIDDALLEAHYARKRLDDALNAVHVVVNDARVDDSLEEAQVPLESLESSEYEPVSVTAKTVAEFLARRYPDAKPPSDAGLEFAVDLVEAAGFTDLVDLDLHLNSQNFDPIQSILYPSAEPQVSVTSTRRLDDELLALLGVEFIENTIDLGEDRWKKIRADRLRWQWELIGNKVVDRRLRYSMAGRDVLDSQRERLFSAARAVREVITLVGLKFGVEKLADPRLSTWISLSGELKPGWRPTILHIDGSDLWVATNFNRAEAEHVLVELLQVAHGLGVRVLKDGAELS